MRHNPDINLISAQENTLPPHSNRCLLSNCISIYRIILSRYQETLHTLSLLLEDPLDLDEGEAVRLPDGERGPDGHGGDHGAE